MVRVEMLWETDRAQQTLSMTASNRGMRNEKELGWT